MAMIILPISEFILIAYNYFKFMKFNYRYIIIPFVLIISIFSVNAYILNSNVLGYYKFENASNIGYDTTRSFDGTNFGSSNISSINSTFGSARSFDGVNDYINLGNRASNLTKSISWYAYIDSSGTFNANTPFFSDVGSVDVLGNYIISRIYNSPSQLIFSQGSQWSTGAVIRTNNVWYHYALTCDGTTIRYYRNGENVVNVSDTYCDMTNKSANFMLALEEFDSDYSKIRLDEVAFFNETLTQQDIKEIMNWGIMLSLSPILTIDNINLVNNTYLNLNYLNLSLNISNSSTNNLINTTLYLSNGSSYQIGTNTQNVSYTLNNIQEGTYNFWTYSYNNETNVTSQNYTYIFDFTSPVINNNINSTSFYYSFSPNSSCSDSYLDYCNITINSQNLALNTSSITTTLNGNISYTIFSRDLAGNTNNESGVILINPFQYFYFENASSDLINNYSINGTLYSNYVFSFPLFNYGYGTTNFIFNKLGFNETLFSITLNSSSNLNQTFSLPSAKIIFKVYDLNDFSELENSTIEIIGDSYSDIFTLTNTYTYNLTSLELEEETYYIIASRDDYETASTSFNFNNQEVIEVSIYMTPTSVNRSLIADLVVNVIDSVNKGGLEDIITHIYVWDSSQSQYVESNQRTTDYNGQTSYKVFLNTKLYNICAEYNNVLYCKYDKTYNVNTLSETIEIPVNEIENIDTNNIYDVDFSYSLVNTTSIINTSEYHSITFTYNNPNLDIDNYCLLIYQVITGKQNLVASQCSTNHNSALSINILKNTSNNYIAKAQIEQDGNYRILESPIYLYSTTSLQEGLNLYGFGKLLILVVVIGIITIGLTPKVHNVAFIHIGLSIAMFFLSIWFNNYISFETFLLTSMVNLLAFKFISSRDDLGSEVKFNKAVLLLGLYIMFIFSLVVILSEMQDKGLTDDYSDNLLTFLEGKETYFSSMISSSEASLKAVRDNADAGAWELIVGIFLKTLEFADTFFNILQNLFNIPSTFIYILGLTQYNFLLSLVSILDWIITAYIIRLYFIMVFK